MLTLIVLATLSAVLGAAAALYTLRQLYWIAASKHWPTAEGKILPSKEMWIDDRPLHGDIIYEYWIEGRRYLGDTFRFGHNPRQVASRYPPGQTVLVHYHPRKPSVAVLEPGGAIIFTLIVVLGALLLFAVGVAIILWKVVPPWLDLLD